MTCRCNQNMKPKIININPATGDVEITTYPPGAKIYVDNIFIIDEKGEPILTPVRLTITEGLHDIILTLEGYCNEFDIIQIFPNDIIYRHKNFYIC